MHGTRRQEIQVGLASLLAVILLLGGVLWGEGLFSAVANGENEVKFLFPSSGGIKPSNPVTYKGVTKGQVESVELYGDSVLVTATIEDITDIESDASARITMLEITGGKKLEILPGTSDSPLNRDRVIRGVATADLGQLIAEVGSISGDAKNLILRLDTITTAATDLLRDGQFMEDLKYSVGEARTFVDNANATLAENRSTLRNTLNNAESLTADLRTAIDRNTPQVEKLLDSLNFTVSNANNMIYGIEGSIGDADKLLLDLRTMLSDMKTNKSALNMLMYDQQFAMKLDSAMSTFGDFIRLVEEHGVNVNLRLGTRP
jgi:phospholipid/cholesterol/gamma-HCH transport system substrate-binding protein